MAAATSEASRSNEAMNPAPTLTAGCIAKGKTASELCFGPYADGEPNGLIVNAVVTLDSDATLSRPW